VPQRFVHRERAHRAPIAATGQRGADLAGDGEGALEDPREQRMDRTLRACGVIGRAHLTGDLRLAADRRIQSAGHPEQVRDRGAAFAKLERHEIVGPQAGALTDESVGIAVRREHEIQLDPVTGRQDDAVRAGRGGRRGGDPLARVEGRGPLMEMQEHKARAGRNHRR